MKLEEPHTHPIRPSLRRAEVDPDVLALADRIINMIRCEELWYILQEYKNEVSQEDNAGAGDGSQVLSGGDSGGRVAGSGKAEVLPGLKCGRCGGFPG